MQCKSPRHSAINQLIAANQIDEETDLSSPVCFLPQSADIVLLLRLSSIESINGALYQDMVAISFKRVKLYDKLWFILTRTPALKPDHREIGTQPYPEDAAGTEGERVGQVQGDESPRRLWCWDAGRMIASVAEWV